MASQLTSEETVRLRSYQGRPVLLIFYNPNSQTAETRAALMASVFRTAILAS